MIEFKCHACSMKLQVAENQAGQTVQCPQCQKQQTVPVPGTTHHGVVCTNCRNELNVDASMAGTLQRCPHCSAMVLVPGKAEGEGCLGLVALLLALATTGFVCLVQK